ncbi:MAG TPA: glycosyltransferase [Desulfatiglandales bacterium]|nr:glycosyltransferase [Desulfatiglandales bacterium]
MKLLVFNCHEAWVYQLGVLNYELDIIVGLKGRYTDGWDERMRPVPKNGEIITLHEALHSADRYDCIITHNITDMLDVKSLSGPRIIVLHSTLDGRLSEEVSKISPEKMKTLLLHYLELVGGHTVAVSQLKGDSWGLSGDIINSGVNTDDYLPFSGDKPKGLRICNEVSKRRKTLFWSFFEKAFSGIPMDIVGYNPDMQGVNPARNWNHLKEMLSSHRFYIHTADPRFEDGFNMATLEAMAAGMPILGNLHPTSPVEHGVSGFLSDDPDELRAYAMMLITNRDLAMQMGKEARRTVAKQFSLSRFKEKFERSIKIARRKFEAKRMISNGNR